MPSTYTHRDKFFPLRHDQIEDAAHVRRDDLSGGAHLSTQELLPPPALDASGPHGLQGHVYPQLQVEGTEYLTHSALAQDLANLAPFTQDPPRRERMFARDGFIIGEGVRVPQSETEQTLRTQPRDPGLRNELGSAVRAASDFRQAGHCLLSDRKARKSHSARAVAAGGPS